MESQVIARVTRQFDASPERVFDAWLNPEFATRWLFTSPTSDRAGRRMEIDARVGGKYVIADRRDGIDFVGDGEYVEIDRPRRLVFTFRMVQFSPTIDRITVEIATLENGCMLTVTQEITMAHDADAPSEQVQRMLASYKSNIENGWGKMFHELAKHLAA